MNSQDSLDGFVGELTLDKPLDTRLGEMKTPKQVSRAGRAAGRGAGAAGAPFHRSGLNSHNVSIERI